MKKISVLIIILFAITIIGITFRTNLRKTDNISNNKINFQKLIQYQTNSIADEKKTSKIFQTLEFVDYHIETTKEFYADGERLILYYDCVDEEKIKNYYRNSHNISLLERDSTVLFSLINNLKEIKFVFKMSNVELSNSHHLSTLPTEYTYTREIIEEHYNQDVRNYIENPNIFMNYNIDLNISDITVYYREYSNLNEINSINVNEKEKVETIVQYIEKQNFGVPNEGYNGVCNIWIDLNNGFIIGVYGENYDNYGCIIKGNGKEIFASENPNTYILSNSVYKLLPEGLTEYIEQIIQNNK